MRRKSIARTAGTRRPTRQDEPGGPVGPTLAQQVLGFEAYTGMPSYEIGVLAGLIVAFRAISSWVTGQGRTLRSTRRDWIERGRRA